ncbi:MAG TPA: guanylate kinase [candidate division WOR-3 bacterium]|uniref:Guanylate kinase n=1 Tax=candidate division WOR-3 bacterium TaxID=2052148 RepID=A0A7C5HN68_UNCW3|nr:guanylate kinase [candidate division WOR-3 bacterium]
MSKGMLIVVSGPSGVGKSTVVREVMKRLDGLSFSISHTTRKPRGKEQHGREYYFVSREEFEDMIEKGEFIEWAEVYGNLYGTSKRELERRVKEGDVLLDIDVQGAMSIKRLFPDSIRILLFPPSMEELSNRLRNRKDTTDLEIKKRLKVAEWEISMYREFTHVVINDELEKAVDGVTAIIKGERLRTERMMNKIKEML